MAGFPLRARRLALIGLLALVGRAPLRADHLPISLYTAADGLGSSDVLSIVPDSRGFLWFTTRNGLSRFDGTEFRSYTMDDGLPHPIVNHLLETSDGEHWIGTNGGGVCRFNVEGRRPASQAGATAQRLFTCQNVGSHFQSNRVNVLYEDRRHRIWVGTDHGVFRLLRGGGTWHFEPLLLDGVPPGVTIGGRRIHEDAEGRVWIAYDGLLRVDPDGRMALYSFQGADLTSVKALASDEGVLWVGSRFGLVGVRPTRQIRTAAGVDHVVLDTTRACFPHQSFDAAALSREGDVCISTVRDGLPANDVQSLVRSAPGRLWIGTSGGLARIDGLRLISLAAAENLVGAGHHGFARDRDGHLWIATTVGAMKLTVDGLVSYGPRDGLDHPRILAILEHTNGTLFAVGGDWLVSLFDGTRFQSKRPRIADGLIYSYASRGVFLDRTNRWWLLTDMGLYRLRPAATIDQAAAQPPEAVYTTRNGLPGNRVVRLFEDSRGDIWIATRSPQSAINLSRWSHLTHTIAAIVQPTAARWPVAFAEDRRGTVWVGFEAGGLVRYAGGRLTSFAASAGVPSDIVDLHVDQAGRLWIASSSEGLSVAEDVAADHPRFRRYTTAQDLASNNIRSLTEDLQGRVYFGTGRGVDRLDPLTGRVKHFTTADGLAADTVTAAFRDRSGALWFGTLNGLSRLRPVADAPSTPPPVWIGEVRIGGRLYATTELGQVDVEPLTLPADQNHVQVGFFGVSFDTSAALRYRYRLEGAERDWTGPTTRRVVHYAALSPGRYRFVVEAVTGDGVPSARPAVVGFTVLAPVWRRWWFLTLFGLSLAILAYTAHRYRVSRLVELERVRTRIAADLHDDIGGTLSRIVIQSEVARREVGEQSGPSAPRLGEIADAARAVVDALGDVVWSVDPRQDDLASVERRLREYADDLLSARGIKWRFQGTGRSDRLNLDPQTRRNLLLLLKEGVTNIARHSGATHASLHLLVADGQLRADLSDDGEGFDAARTADRRSNGHGLINMRTRAKQLRGTLHIESSPGVGTTLRLVVPFRGRRRMNMRLMGTRL